jgi:hypothetical protein
VADRANLCPNLKGKYTYTKTGEPAKTVSAKEAAPKKPVGVPDPETKKEE